MPPKLTRAQVRAFLGVFALAIGAFLNFLVRD